MGAYLPLRTGGREFIEDEDTYEQRYQEEWAEELKQQEEEKKLREKESPFGDGILKEFKDKGFFKLDAEGNVQRGDDPWTEDVVETDKIQFADKGIGGNIPVGMQKNMIGVSKMVSHGLSNVVNFPFALHDLAKTQGALPYQQIHDLFKSEEQKEKDQEASLLAFNELLRTGKKPDGSSYGIQKDWGLFGEMFSPDSELQKELRPTSFWGKLGADIISALTFEGGTRFLAKTAPNIVGGTATKQLSLNIPQSYGVWKGITERNLSKVYKGIGAWFLKEGLYEIGVDMMFIRPQLPESYHNRIDEIQQIASPKERIEMMQMISADTEEDFNLAAETIKEWPITLGSMVLLRGLFKYVNHALNDVSKNGVDVQTALKAADKKVLPEIVKEIEPIAAEKTAEGIEVQLGKINKEMNRLVDQSALNIASGARAGAESYIAKKSQLSEGIPELQKRLKGTEPLVQDVKEIDSQISNLQTKYFVKTDAQIAKKIKDQTKRVKDYERAIKKDPNWFKSLSNKRKYNSAVNAAKSLRVLQELRKARGSMVVEQAGLTGDVFDLREGLSEELESIFSEIGEGQIGFNNSINDATLLIQRFEELDLQRRELLRAKGISSEIDLQFPGVQGFVMRKLRQLINDVGVARAAGNLDDKYMNKVVQEFDELHHKLIDEGGAQAPVVPEQPKELNIKGDNQKIEKLTGDLEDDPWLSGANEVVEETTKKGAAEVVEEGTETAGKQTVDVEATPPPADAGKLTLPQALEEIVEEAPEIKKKGWKKLLRTLPEGQQAEVAIDRIIAAWDKFEKGVSAKNRLWPVSTVGDLVRFLNIARVMIEEGTQKGLRDVEKTLAAYDKLTLSPSGRRRNLQEWFHGMKGMMKAVREVRDIRAGKKPDPKPSLFGTTPETQKALPPIREDGKIPKEPSPVELEAPITTTKEDVPVVDADELARRAAAGKPFRGEGTKAKQRRTVRRNRTPKFLPAPEESTVKKQFDQFQQNIVDAKKRVDDYLKENPDDFKGAYELANRLFSKNTSGRLYNSTDELAEVFTAQITAKDLYRTPKNKTINLEMIRGAKKIAQLINDDDIIPWERLTFWPELEDISQNMINKLNMVAAGVALIDDTTNTLMRETRVLNKYFSAQHAITSTSLADTASQVMIDGKIVTKAEATYKWYVAYTNFNNMLKATERTFYAAGNFLALFKQKNRLRFLRDPLGKPDPKSVFGEINKEIFDRLGDEAQMSKVFKENLEIANKDFEKNVNPIIKKIQKGETLTPAEEVGFQQFVDKLGRTGGDVTAMKELEITSDSILARLQVGNPLSTMMAPFNLPIQGLADMNFQLFSRMFMMGGDKLVADWLLKDSKRAAESLKEFLWARDTILNTRLTFGQGLKDSYWRFLLGRSISDPSQATNKAWKIAQGGVVREQAILDDLAREELQIPLVNWVLKKGNMNKTVFDALNYARVGMKVFHDYAIPGEAWDLRGGLGKALGASTSIIRSATGLGTKSYYPGGEQVNMTLWPQLFAPGDELISSMYANASVQSRVTQNVREAITQKLNKGEWTLDQVPAKGSQQYKNMLEAEMKAMYTTEKIQPVSAGFTNQVIGNAVIDKQIHELTQIANRTEELEGIRLGAQKMVEALTKSEHQLLRWLGREFVPITVAPLNEMKKIIMIAGGGEVVQATTDLGRYGIKKALDTKVMGENLSKYTGTQWFDNLKNFESKYTSSDIATRAKAQTALGWSIALNTTIFMMTLDGEQEITGSKMFTYKSDKFAKKPYTWTVGGVDIPYRYLGLFGSAVAMHVNSRDVSQFGSERGDGNFMTMAIMQMANTILELPHSQGFQQAQRLAESIGKGDPSYAMSIASKAISKMSSPHMTARKQLIEGFLPQLPSKPESRFGKGWHDKGKPWEKIAQGASIEGVFTGGMNLIQRTYEHDIIGLMANLIHPIAVGVFDGYGGGVNAKDIYYNSRQAVWHEVPGQPFQSEFTGATFLPKVILGRTYAFPNHLRNKVNAAITLYQIKGADHRIYASKKYGSIILNDRTLNTFNHYLQNEYESWSNDGKTLLTGANAMLLDTIESPYFSSVSLPPTSPYKVPRPLMPWFMEPIIGKFFQPDVDWNRAENPRRQLLQNRRDTILQGGKEAWYLQSIKHYKGELTLRFPMPEDMVNRIMKNRQMELEIN